ncbi:MAG: helix-turn-helix transcriptional regulator [Candidatus Thorarchaeota archaeon]
MENLKDLLFELANEDRLNILDAISKKAMKLTEVSKTLELTMQETSRHLQRLSNARLVQKKADGAYHLTLHGTNVLSLLPGLDFLVEHREYFLTHRTSHLPREFLIRIGELHGSNLLDNPLLALQRTNTIIEDANEHLWFIADQVPTGSIPLIEAAIKRGVSACFLMPKTLIRPDLPDEYRPQYRPEDQKRMLLGYTETIDFVSTVSESAALVGFPTTDGRMDYLAFLAESELALSWCKDLFLRYWNQVEAVHPTEE